MIRSLKAVAILAAALVTACGNPPSPTPIPTASATASPSAAASSAAPSASAVAECTAGGIQATGGPWGGAAGSRGSDVILENVGAVACLLPAAATVALVDAAGTAVLTSAPAQAGTGPEVAPAGRAGFSLVLGNWCDQVVNLPFHVELALATDAIEIGDLSVTTTDELPPCNGPGQPATLTTTEWQSADPG
jgi:hypothetical protein